MSSNARLEMVDTAWLDLALFQCFIANKIPLVSEDSFMETAMKYYLALLELLVHLSVGHYIRNASLVIASAASHFFGEVTTKKNGRDGMTNFTLHLQNLRRVAKPKRTWQ